MKFFLVLISCCLAVVCGAQQKMPAAIQLFNGKDLADWTIKIKDHPVNENYGNTFRVENGVLKVSYDQYDDFKEQYGHKDFPISLEEQLLGVNGKDERSTVNLCTPGTNVILDNKLYTEHCVNSRSATFHGDQWVHAEALVLGDSIIKHIVGTDTVLVYEKPQYDGRDKWVQQAGLKDGQLIKEGYLSLQSESHPVEFRKVEIYNLEPWLQSPAKLKEVIAQLQHRLKGAAAGSK